MQLLMRTSSFWARYARWGSELAGQFLQAAYRVLDAERKPLNASVIVELAMRRGHLHTRGKTPAHTMRARLSDDIRRLGAESAFLRMGPNRFSLREWGSLNEYHAQPFRKSIPNEIVVCVPGTVQQRFASDTFGYAPAPEELIAYLSQPSNLTFLERRVAETTSKFKQLVAYVWLETAEGLVLTYTRGKYSAAHPTLMLGKSSVGFGGHVLQQDVTGGEASFDAFYIQNADYLKRAAAREISEELKGAQMSSLQTVGVIWDDSSFEGQKHIGVVLKGQLLASVDTSFRYRERSINAVRPVTLPEAWDTYHNMEFWSQLILRAFGENHAPEDQSMIVPAKRPKDVSQLALVGEIASGKTALCSAIATQANYEVVSASGCLAELLHVPLAKEEDRLDFQASALEYIRSKDGPERLAAAIHAKIRAHGRREVIVDGLRQRSTLDALRVLIPHLLVVYVDCPRDLAFMNYGRRWSGADILSFSAVREHPVETDLPNLRFGADAIVHNADRLDVVAGRFVDWLRG